MRVFKNFKDGLLEFIFSNFVRLIQPEMQVGSAGGDSFDHVLLVSHAAAHRSLFPQSLLIGCLWTLRIEVPRSWTLQFYRVQHFFQKTWRHPSLIQLSLIQIHVLLWRNFDATYNSNGTVFGCLRSNHPLVGIRVVQNFYKLSFGEPNAVVHCNRRLQETRLTSFAGGWLIISNRTVQFIKLND